MLITQGKNCAKSIPKVVDKQGLRHYKNNKVNGRVLVKVMRSPCVTREATSTLSWTLPMESPPLPQKKDKTKVVSTTKGNGGSDTAPRAGGQRTRSPSTRPPHVPDPPHEGCTEGGGSGEEEGAPGPATTDEGQSYLDLFLDTCCVHYFVCSNYFMYFRIQFLVISHL
jgi:hypothetical protein